MNNAALNKQSYSNLLRLPEFYVVLDKNLLTEYQYTNFSICTLT